MAMETKIIPLSEEKTATVKKTKGHFRRNWAFYLLLLGSIGTMAYTWVTKEYALQNQKESFEDQQLALLQNVNAAVKQNNEKQLTLVAQSLAYAVANRVIFDDWEEVDLYFRQMVKADNVLEIFLLQDDELIMVSTNKKQEEEFYKDSHSAAMRETESILFLQDDARRHLIAAPVMMKENRQSTVLIVYEPAAEIKL